MVPSAKWEQWYWFLQSVIGNTANLSKVMNKIVLAIACLTALSSSSGFLLAQETHKNPVPEEIKVPGEPETYFGGKAPVNYLYPDNSDKKESQLTKKEKAVGQLKKGLILKETKLKKYSQYILDKKQRGGDIVENAQIHPNRLMWVSEIDAPEGLELPKKNGDPLKFRRKSKIIIVTDAETAMQISTDIFEVK